MRSFALIWIALVLGAVGAHAAGDAAAGQTKAVTCAACHGQDGKTGLMPDYPNLAGQNERYLLRQLEMIKSGERPAPLMIGQLDNFDAQDLADLAAYYASLPGKIGAAQPEDLALGEAIYRGGILDKNVAACGACHGATGSGNGPAGFPALSGQPVDYVITQLTKYREGERQTDAEYGGMMRGTAARLTDGEIRAVANYILGLH